MDAHAKLSPEARAKLALLTREKGRPYVYHLFHMSSETLDNILSPHGGAKKTTIQRIEAELALLPKS